MSEKKLFEITDILDDFVIRIEEYVNSCEDEERCERFIDTVSVKTHELLQEIEHEMELVDLIETDRDFSLVNG